MSNSPPPDDHEARTQRHLAVLDTLINLGLDLATRVHRQATIPTPVEPGSTLAEPGSTLAEPGSTLAEPGSTLVEPGSAQTGTSPDQTDPIIAPQSIALFDQISRAVRRAVLVSRKLAEPLPLAPAKPSPGRLAADRVAARKRIIREVEDTIHREGGVNADALQAELHERVESVDLDDDIGRRSIQDIIAEIHRDLGMIANHEKARFKRRTPQDLAALAARAARAPAPGNPADQTGTLLRPSTSSPEHPDDPNANIQALNGHSKPEPRPPKP